MPKPYELIQVVDHGSDEETDQREVLSGRIVSLVNRLLFSAQIGKRAECTFEARFRLYQHRHLQVILFLRIFPEIHHSSFQI